MKEDLGLGYCGLSMARESGPLFCQGKGCRLWDGFLNDCGLKFTVLYRPEELKIIRDRDRRPNNAK